MPTPIKSDAEKLRILAKYFEHNIPTHIELLRIATNYENLENRIFKLENEDIQNRISIAVSETESEMEKKYIAKINRLSIALHNIIDATEDKNGQFRAWHQHLRETTYNGKQVLNEQNQRDTTTIQ